MLQTTPIGSDKEKCPIFDGDGRLICELPDDTAFLHVCDPGQYLFIAGAGSKEVSVVSAEVEENRVYDVFVVGADLAEAKLRFWIGMDEHTSPRFVPLAKGDPRRVILAEYARRERWMVGSPTSKQIARYGQQNRARIQEIKTELGGSSKSDQVLHLRKDDCR